MHIFQSVEFDLISNIDDFIVVLCVSVIVRLILYVLFFIQFLCFNTRMCLGLLLGKKNHFECFVSVGDTNARTVFVTQLFFHSFEC